jgi:hypothetical protein
MFLVFFSWCYNLQWARACYHGFTITLRHTTLSRTPLGEWSALKYRHLPGNRKRSEETDRQTCTQIHNPRKQAAAEPTNQPTNSTQHSPTTFSASQKISHILWNPTVYYCSQRLTFNPCPSHVNNVNVLPPYIFKTQFTAILWSMPRSYRWTLSFRFLHKNSACINSNTTTATQKLKIKGNLTTTTCSMWLAGCTIHLLSQKHSTLPTLL